MTEMLPPVQQRVLDELLGRGLPRPEWPTAYATALRDRFEKEIAEIVEPLGDGFLAVGKAPLGWVHRCEGLFVAQKAAPFEWTVPMMRGRIVHRAIEAMLAEPAAAPLDAIDAAADALVAGEEQDSVARFLKGLAPLEMARLKAQANETVATFASDWPKVREFMPRIESKIRARLCAGRVRLDGQCDLVVGTPRGNQARLIVVDFKSGAWQPSHVDDLRYYALVLTFKNRVPPYRVATYYIEESDFHLEEVTEEMLDAAYRRTTAGIRRMMAARGGSPELTPGGHCRWCPARTTCSAGVEWVRVSNEDADEPRF